MKWTFVSNPTQDAEAIARETGTDGASLRLYPNPKSSPLRAAVAAWGLELCAARPDLYSDTVSAIRDVKHAFRAGVRAQEGIDR